MFSSKLRRAAGPLVALASAAALALTMSGTAAAASPTGPPPTSSSGNQPADNLGWKTEVVSAEFDESYDGDLDGFAWREQRFRELQQQVTATVLRTLAGMRGWRVRTGNRGLPATDEVLIHVDLDLERG